jgi:thiamine-phosphate pyrophosphorylase
VIEGADYIGFGPLFPTPTKPGRPAIGLENISQVETGVGSKLPVFCIGGINSGNLGEVIEAGARRVVMVSELLQAKDIVERCREVKDLLEANPAG